MKKMNLIVVFNKEINKVLMCKRTKNPYKDMYNFVGGKIESDDSLSEAYRELFEETNITKNDTDLVHFMNLTYITFDIDMEVYYGILNKDVTLVEEVNKLEWISLDENFFDIKKFAGEGNVGHILEEIKREINKTNN